MLKQIITQIVIPTKKTKNSQNRFRLNEFFSHTNNKKKNSSVNFYGLHNFGLEV